MIKAHQILETLTWIHPHERQEILFRTMSKRLPLTGDIGYKKVKSLQKELESVIAPHVMKGYDTKKTHDENCIAHLQSTFVSGEFWDDAFSHF